MKQLVFNWWCVLQLCLEGLTVLLKRVLNLENKPPPHHKRKHPPKHINKDTNLIHRTKHHGTPTQTRSRETSQENET
jgi:hypothetical protein